MRSILTAVVSLAAGTVQKLHSMDVVDPVGTVPHALDPTKVFLKPLVARPQRTGTPASRQRIDAINMFRVFELLSTV